MTGLPAAHGGHDPLGRGEAQPAQRGHGLGRGRAIATEIEFRSVAVAFKQVGDQLEYLGITQADAGQAVQQIGRESLGVRIAKECSDPVQIGGLFRQGNRVKEYVTNG